MYNFFVLGLIPGTDIQISFLSWVGVTGLLVAIYWLPTIKRRLQMRHHMTKIEAFNASLRKLDGELGS